jgi:hypothetical protein
VHLSRLRPAHWAISAVALAALLALIALLAAAPLAQQHTNPFALGDLRAFTCAGRVALAGADPYASEPLGACERKLVGLRGNFVIPAPLPGDAIGLFELLARLPFTVVAAGWCVLLAVLYLGTSTMLTRLTGWRFAYVAAITFPLAFAIPVNLGQLVPLSVALVVGAALALKANRDMCAAVFAALSTIEPHIGLPVCIALAIARPRSRGALGVAAVGLGALAVSAIGPAGVIEYCTRVLPAHIASETRFDDQYSLTYLLTWLGVAGAPAIALGQLSYCVIGGGAVAAGIRAARMSGDSSWLLFVPAAFSVAGGPYVHEEHLFAAVPLGLLVVAAAPSAAREVSTIALVLVAWPAKFVLERLPHPMLAMHIDTAFFPFSGCALAPLAEALWSPRIASHAGHALFLAAKAPTWIGLLLLATAFAPPKLRARVHLWRSRMS